MSDDKTGGAAFPRRFSDSGMDGMSLRDYFAARAMECLLKAHIDGTVDDLCSETIAGEAYLYADAMIVRRAKLVNAP